MPFQKRLKGMVRTAGVVAVFMLGAATAGASDGETLLLSQPTISKDTLAFVYAGDIWTANRDGSDPRRVTTHAAGEEFPTLSPDGQWIAFEAAYDNNRDVYVISTAGGQPRRLTWHPGRDWVDGWTPDGREVVFASSREMRFGRSGQIHHVPLAGGFPRRIMDAPYFRGAWSDDGERLAYLPTRVAYSGLYGGGAGWRGYRGGANGSITILNPTSGETEEIPGGRVNDINPMWIGGAVYFLSDRNDKVFNVYRYDPASKDVTQVTEETVWDIRSASAYGTAIVYEAGGRLKELDTESGTVTEITISINPDLPQRRPQWKDAKRNLERAELSPTALRVIVTARGEVFTVPVEDGSTRNLTDTDGVRETGAIWSPKGGKVAYISGEGNRHRLVLADQHGKREKTLDLGTGANAQSFYFLLHWTSDGKSIVYRDNHRGLFAIEVETGERKRITTFPRRYEPDVAGSPDGRWLAFTRIGDNLYSDLMLFNFQTGQTTRITNGMAEVGSPAFSPDGKYIYFGASTNVGPRQVGLDMSSQEKPSRFGLYALVLAEDGKSPLLPGTGDEEVKSDEDEDSDSEDEDKNESKTTKIDLDGLAERIVALPVAEAAYDSLVVGEDGSLYYIERVQPGVTREPPGEEAADENKLVRFDFEEKEAVTLTTGVRDLSISADAKTLLVSKGDEQLFTAKAGEKLELEAVNLSEVKLFVDPAKEWAQIFDEAWRMSREYFYDPNMHGLDWDAVYERYKPLVAHVGRREDLNQLMVQMIAEMQVGHNNVVGGDVHRETPVAVGLLGADLAVENGRYRIKRILTGENWNPFLEAPLAAPGLGVEAGDYILAINGRDLPATENIFSRLSGQVGKQVTLTINGRPRANGARDIVVEPVSSESDLRRWDWVEANRAYVEEKTDGKVGYVYLPNTAGDGYRFFNRMFFPQANKDAMIIDERRNSGGQAANYITDVLSRTYLSGWKDRNSAVFNTPGGAVYGPKVMLIDQDAGSGGDFLPYSFRAMNLGTLIGTRTWGGLIGIYANPQLIDGGVLTVPFFRFFTPDGEWTIENEGVAPDIDVPLAPAAYNKGQDVQLDRAITEVMKQLEDYTPVDLKEAPAAPTELGQ